MTFDPAEHGWTKLDNMGFGGLVGPFWAKDEAEGRALGILTDARHANRAGMIHGGMPVPYTHLDVYKRQVVHNGCAANRKGP